VVIPRHSPKRWQGEVFLNPVKSKVNLAKSATRTVKTQSNLVFLSICAAFKLDCLGGGNRFSPFALYLKLLILALLSAYAEL
jgi:hypothetical protein